MAAASSSDKSIIVGTEGVIISAVSGSNEWQRLQVEGKPTFIDITSCTQGLLAALTMGGEVWTSTDQAQTWNSHPIATAEVPQAITCDTKGTIWVVGSFSTIFSSSDFGETWRNHSFKEDMILSTIQFLDEDNGVITGEFGTLLITKDGGENWDFSRPIPKEFFPLASLFIDDQHGWVVGLNGIVYRTQDGGTNWQQEETGTDAPLYGISLVNDTVIVVGDYGSIIHKNIEDNLDGSWKKLETPLKSRLFFRVVHPLENNKVIIAGAAGSLEIIEIE